MIDSPRQRRAQSKSGAPRERRRSQVRSALPVSSDFRSVARCSGGCQASPRVQAVLSPKSPRKMATRRGTDFFGRPLGGAVTPRTPQRTPQSAQDPNTPRTARPLDATDEEPSFFPEMVTVGRLRAAPNSALTRQQVYFTNDMKALKGRAAIETAIEPDAFQGLPSARGLMSSFFSAPSCHSARRRRSKSHKGPRRS